MSLISAQTSSALKERLHEERIELSIYHAMFQLKCLETAWIDHHLFVVCDSATLIANARLESLFWNRLCRTGLRKLVINRDEASLRRALKGFVYSFSYRVILERQGADINVQ
jgi:hypothetical protein